MSQWGAPYNDEGYNNVGNAGGGAGVIGALIGAGAGMYDSYQNRKTSKENTNKTLAAQKAESELAYQRSVEMWNQQNLYNSPEAQMQRFKEAGLNPHLIYGQGSSGNASSPPQYQPANLQYDYQAPKIGASIQSILPTLMAVGSWMQNMRLSEAELQKKNIDVDKTQQMIDFLMERNPQLLKESENKLSLYPYQFDMQRHLRDKASMTVSGLEQDFRAKFGEQLFQQYSPHQGNAPIGGLTKLKFLQEQSKAKLLDAKASWSDFSITDPQAIMQLVLSGVMGLAGQTLRMNSKARNVPVRRERPRGLSFNRMSRNHPDRR